mmetsp:Transcript_24249/g.52304  ORF Transcript_24249/g.52304 Transcript_24249/m.52304 type:complete len:371 (-) Transcript_24249:186-1298(-)
MADEPPQWNDEFSSDGTPSNDGGTSSDGGASSDYEREEEPNQRPLQLPRVGWGTDDNDEDGAYNNTQDPTDADVPIPAMKHDEDDGVSLRAMSRNSEGELAPIPEDISMHGTWPDYYPDMLGCYNDDRHKYKYRRCAPNFKQRLCTVILIVFAAIIGSKVSSKIGGEQKQHLPQPSNSDNTANGSGNVENVEINGKYRPVDANGQHPDADAYQVIVDTLNPMMFDDSNELWDGTFFHAFEFCGRTYARVPCPYIAYCPLGPGKAPLGGTKIDFNGSWAPIDDAEQADWVQLGRDGTCDLYSKKDGNPPSWGNIATKDAPPGITRHVMCCLEAVDGGGKTFPLNDPDIIDRPPSLEEDEVEKTIPMREEEP